MLNSSTKAKYKRSLNEGGNDYSYDVNGNLTEDKNKAVTIAYDSYTDKPNKISQTSTGDYVSYVYDASGERLKKIIKQGTTTITYTYIDGFTYRKTATATNTNPTDTLLYFAHDEGRVRRNYKNQLVYDYFIEDHLGNIRMVLTEEVDQVGYVSTFEPPKDGIEPPIFGPQRDVTKELINSTFPYYIPDPDATAPPNTWHSRLNANDVNRRTGSSVILKVMAGDALDISVKAFYKSTDPVPAGGSVVNDMVQSLLGALLGNQTSLVPNGKGNLVSGNSAIVNQSDIGNFINGTQNDPNNQYTNTPKAYLNYVLFDENFTAVGNGYKRVNTADVQTVYSFPGVSVPVNGYVYVWISNESGMNVYFDDLSVQHTTGPIVQENTFYPYGLPIEPLRSYAAIKTANKELYQSKLLDDEMGLNLYYFDARYFDPQTGRFLGMDPKMQLASGYQGMGGNPAMYTDPDGQFFGLDDLIVSAVGFVTGYVSSGIKTGSWGWKSVQSGLMSAAGFEIGYLTGGAAWNAEFAANFFGNAAALVVMGNYIAGTVVSSVVGQFMPSVPIIQSRNFNLSLSPSFAVGSGGWSAGINASATASIGNFDIGIAGGVSYGHNNITGVTESSSYLSGRAGAHMGNLHYGLTSTQFGGSFSQRVGGAYAGYKDLNVQYENDWFANTIPTGDGGDKYRTTGAKISYRDISIGLHLFTGDPGLKNREVKAGPGLKGTYISGTVDNYRAGILYAGYGNYQFGINSERVRDFFQNHLAHKDGDKFPLFRQYGRKINPYFSYQSINPFTVW